jgi:Leucine-rich repeat (LRR) protein
VFTSLPHLTFLAISHNFLTGDIPDSLTSLTHLQYLDLAHNYLSGTLPSALGGLASLQQLFLYYNRLHGTVPASFAALTSLVSLQLQLNDLSGSLDNAFDPALQKNLAYVVLEGNQFSGSLPEGLLASPSLRGFYLSQNCFDGELTSALCGATSLEQASMSCLSCACGSTTLSDYRVTGTVPTCLFSLTHLQRLSLSGNYLSGSIPMDIAINPLLQYVDLSFNQLTGQIPSGLQTNGMEYLNLRYNRFSGELLSNYYTNDTFHGMAAYSDNLEHNRLSGHIPSSQLHAPDVKILDGNLFACKWERSDLPEHDKYTDHYRCGSDDYNRPYYTWMILLFVAAVVGAYTLHPLAREVPPLQRWRELFLFSYEEVCLDTVNRVFDVARKLAMLGVAFAAMIVLVLAPAYAALTYYYGTYTYQYAWTLAAVLLSGVTPFVVVFILIALVTLVFAYLYHAAFSTGKSLSASREQRESRLFQEGRRLKVLCACSAYVLSNLIIVGGINLAFVAIVQYGETSFQIVLSLFKVTWNAVCLPYMSRRLVYRLSALRSGFFTLELFVSLMNNVLLPLGAVAILSPQCFSGSLVDNTGLAKFEQGCTASSNCTSPFYMNGTTTYTEYNVDSALSSYPFHYSFQCSYSYMDFYAAAFIYMSMFATFGIPALQLVLLWLHRTLLWCAPLRWVLPRIFKPPVATGQRDFKRDVLLPYFDATQFLVTQLTYLALMLSLGVIAPSLAACLAVTMLATTTFMALKVGRFITLAAEAKLPGLLEVLRQECSDVVSPAIMMRAFWMVLIFSAVFVSFFLFDILGDSVGAVGAVWVFLALPALPASAWVAYSAVQGRGAGTQGLVDDAQLSAWSGSVVEEVELAVVTAVLSPMAEKGQVSVGSNAPAEV